MGATDELLDAEKLQTEVRSTRADWPVFIVEGMGHSDMVTRPEAIRALVTTLE